MDQIRNQSKLNKIQNGRASSRRRRKSSKKYGKNVRTKLTNEKTPGNNNNNNKTNALEKLKFFTFVSVRVSYKDYILHTRCAVVVVG